MGILNLKKNKIAVAEATRKTRKLAVVSEKGSVVPSASASFDPGVLIRPRVTEKATELSKNERTVVVFEVSRSANKRTVAEAVRNLYKVAPQKVAVLKIRPKRKFVRGKKTHGTTGYKAYVYLRQGDKIEVA